METPTFSLIKISFTDYLGIENFILENLIKLK